MRFTSCVVVVLTLFAGCRRERVDPRVAEVTTPARVTVRVVDVPEHIDCSAAGDWWAQLKCRLTRAPRSGCTYVEVGSTIDAPLRRTGPIERNACHLLGGDRVKLLDMPVRRVKVEFDDAGTRGAVIVNDDAWVLYLHDGELVELRYRGAGPEAFINTSVYRNDAPMLRGAVSIVSDGGVDWAHIAPLLAVIPSHPNTFSEQDLDAEFERTPNAQDIYNGGVADALEAKKLTPRDEAWARMARRLDDTGRRDVRESMLSLLRQGDEDALAWVEADEEIPREQFIEALRGAMDEMQYTSPLLVEALFRLQPDVAAPLACKQLENHELNLEDDGSGDYSELSTAFALIARFKGPCPWVVPMLLRVQCSEALRRVPTEADDPSFGNLPLASAKDRARALALLFTNPSGYSADDEDFLADGAHWGWLLMAAAEAQGPLPEEFVRRNARRTYRVIDTFRGNDFDDPCTNESQAPGEWACRMPLSLTSLERGFCRLELDDRAQTLKLSPTAGWVTPTE